MKKYLFYFIIILFSNSCGSSKVPTNKVRHTEYKKETNTLHPQFEIFNVNDSISELHYKVANKELLYTRPDGINFFSNLLISYRLYASYHSKEILDSGSVRVIDQNNTGTDKFLIGKLDVKALKPRSYVRMKVTDLNRKIEASGGSIIEKHDDVSRQNFLVKSTETDAPIFRNYIKMGEKVNINYKSKMSVTIFVHYYKRNFPLAAPPFSTTDPKPFQYNPDSTFVLELSKDGAFNFSPNKKGFYHFQLDTTKREGLTLFNFSDVFPEVRKTEDMILPLRYITSRQEYDDLNNSVNKKAAIEKFWLDCTGNQERAKEIIRKYYNRVQDANSFFSSYVEGWKTDRGMIYLIYGSPNIIYKTATSETWTYGEENNINSLTYNFLKVDNPFTDNDYSLDRSENYKQSWYVAVDVWRQGRAYLQD